jgi:hypothetical protein
MSSTSSKMPIFSFQLISFILLLKSSKSVFSYCQMFLVIGPQWTDNEYWSRLKHAIELAHQINENIVISGDLNSNLFNVNNNKLVDLMTTFNFRNVSLILVCRGVGYFLWRNIYWILHVFRYYLNRVTSPSKFMIF